VFIPKELPCPVSWFLKAGFISGVPFKAVEVLRNYHKGPSWFAEISGGEHIPVPLIMGVLLNKFEAKSPWLKELNNSP
jgi:hypothetical protein